MIFRSFRDNVQLGTWLAFVAGNVNSIAFVHFGTYVSHVSGHATRASIHYADGDLTSAFLFFMEFMAFIFGAGVTSFLLRGYTAASSQVKYTAPIFIEVLLISVYMILVSIHRSEVRSSDYLSHLTFVLAVAMGLQNAMLRQASGTFVRTTHVTGVATDFGAELGAAVRLAFEELLSLRWKNAGRVFIDRLRKSGFIFHSFILLAFSSGAVFGTIAFLLAADLALLGPITILTVIGITEYRRVLEPQEQLP
ncbi:MAG: YoaK family protein [Bdellovibrionota bacterium]